MTQASRSSRSATSPRVGPLLHVVMHGPPSVEATGASSRMTAASMKTTWSRGCASSANGCWPRPIGFSWPMTCLGGARAFPPV